MPDSLPQSLWIYTSMNFHWKCFFRYILLNTWFSQTFKSFHNFIHEKHIALKIYHWKCSWAYLHFFFNLLHLLCKLPVPSLLDCSSFSSTWFLRVLHGLAFTCVLLVVVLIIVTYATSIFSPWFVVCLLTFFYVDWLFLKFLNVIMVASEFWVLKG